MGRSPAASTLALARKSPSEANGEGRTKVAGASSSRFFKPANTGAGSYHHFAYRSQAMSLRGATPRLTPENFPSIHHAHLAAGIFLAALSCRLVRTTRLAFLTRTQRAAPRVCGNCETFFTPHREFALARCSARLVASAPARRVPRFSEGKSLPGTNFDSATKKCRKLSSRACEQLVGNMALKHIF